MNKLILLSLSLLLGLNCIWAQSDSIIKIHDDLEVVPVAPNVWLHRSYTTFEPYGRFYSNGMIYVVDGECMVFDTPMSKEITGLLLDWIESEAEWKIKGIVVNHFHADCLGGLELFHERGIPSYAMEQTIALAKADSVSVPRIGMKTKSNLRLNGKKIKLYYPGEAHTKDNMVAWLPKEKLIFGGCMVKSVGAEKGNLADANVDAWSETIANVKARYPKAKWVIPGHGMYGGTELLDFTIELFGKAKQSE
ncbi:MAG: subclass B1 metallo-beta-lactamase [Bacteroidia bacterium]